MKNVFRTFLTAVAVFVTLGAAAQEDPSKETVIINPFACTDAVSQAACDNMRAAVLSGFSDRGRFHIVDALTDETLSKLYADRNAEDVVNDAPFWLMSAAINSVELTLPELMAINW